MQTVFMYCIFCIFIANVCASSRAFPRKEKGGLSLRGLDGGSCFYLPIYDGDFYWGVLCLDRLQFLLYYCWEVWELGKLLELVQYFPLQFPWLFTPRSFQNSNRNYREKIEMHHSAPKKYAICNAPNIFSHQARGKLFVIKVHCSWKMHYGAFSRKTGKF